VHANVWLHVDAFVCVLSVCVEGLCLKLPPALVSEFAEVCVCVCVCLGACTYEHLDVMLIGDAILYVCVYG